MSRLTKEEAAERVHQMQERVPAGDNYGARKLAFVRALNRSLAIPRAEPPLYGPVPTCKAYARHAMDAGVSPEQVVSLAMLAFDA